MTHRTGRIVTTVATAFCLLAAASATYCVPAAPAAESAESAETAEAPLPDGVYKALFTTDSSMFHVNEACGGRGVLTVEDGAMSIHVPLAGKGILNLFPGTAEEAGKEGAELLMPTEDEVTYEDGLTEVVYGFDVPVPCLDEEFDLALIGTKGKWYDHKVMVSDPVPAADGTESVPAAAEAAGSAAEAAVAAESGDTSAEAAAGDPVQRAADLIDAIYVQAATPETEAQCLAAKEAWDMLTDEQKEQVEGEFADPDYFGRDTGDASADDPLNGDGAGDKEILVVSFGTSFNDSRAEDIGGIERSIAAAYPEWSVRRAFTAQIIINHILARDGEKIDNMAEALDRAVQAGVKELLVQPTHLMHGAEYDELCAAVREYEDRFDSVTIAEPLLGEVGADAAAVNTDKQAVAEAVVAEAVREAGYGSLEEAGEDGTAFVLLGHGTSHTAKVSYNQMQAQMEELGYGNVFIGTVEGEPEDTSCEAVIEKVKEGGYTKVCLRPLMVVAGDHANNDMAGDDADSWKSLFTADGSFGEVNCQIAGLGRIPAVEDLYVQHVAAAIGE